jgi:peroxiredoxin
MFPQPGTVAPSFTLADLTGARHGFPGADALTVARDHETGAGPVVLDLLVFWKHNCATCELVLPIVEWLYRALGPSGLRLRGVAQSEVVHTREFAARHGLTFAQLDDSACALSVTYEIEVVPTFILADLEGSVLSAFEGWARTDFDALVAAAAARLGVPAPAMIGPDDAVPDFRPGCGSRTFDPDVAAWLAKRQASATLHARRIEVGDLDDALELFFDKGLTDGLPIVPPTEGRVLKMLEGTRRHPQEVVAVMPPNLVPVTVEKIAINAVMAGCRPEYLPVVLASVEAACEERFNLHGIVATTYFPAPLIIVNGPIRRAIGMNAGHNALGQGNRANATIGRALPLVIRNVGGGRPGEIDKCTLGHPGKYTYCFAENEEASPWEPLHVERGFARSDSTVTLFAGEAPRAVMDQASRSARSLCESLGRAIESVMHPKLHGFVDAILVLAPEHVQKCAADGWGKAEIRRAIQKVTARPLRELLPDERCAEGIPLEVLGLTGEVPDAMLNMPLSKFRTDDQLTIVVAGSNAGMFSAIIGGWVSGEMGSQMVTRKVDA